MFKLIKHDLALQRKTELQNNEIQVIPHSFPYKTLCPWDAVLRKQHNLTFFNKFL